MQTGGIACLSAALLFVALAPLARRRLGFSSAFGRDDGRSLFAALQLAWGMFLQNTLARRASILVVHAGLFAVAFGLALYLRFDGAVPPAVWEACKTTLVLLIALRLATFQSARLLGGLWRYTGMPELQRLIAATTAGTAFAISANAMLGFQGTPRSLFAGEWLASIFAVGGMRMLIRATHERSRGKTTGKPTLVIGAGDAGDSFVRELRRLRDGSAWRVIGFLDDHPLKQGMQIHGVSVLGPANEQTLRRVVKQHAVELVVLAMPTAGGQRIRELARLCRQIPVRVMTVPSLAERMREEKPEALREIDIEDLLGRDPVRLDLDQLDAFLKDKVVLVTGAGGSIGSELSRQVLKFEPRKLLLLDHDENALFYIERELREKWPHDRLEALVGDITDERRISWIFDAYHPQVVLHAAAHKHVGMMESNPCEAARNNVFGTRILAEAAHVGGTETFVLISTDKAVNPTSVMGATKRVCEMVVQDIAQHSGTRFAAVRFGNVLGSNGSVVPLFREQIARGGPVTVTHPDVTRYFMTIPEAAQLVLQAGALGGTGEVFLLDMGKPIKIADLARDMIELSGLRPETDIKIAFTGLKSGEKLFEEMLLEGESSDSRPHPQIVVGHVGSINKEMFTEGLNTLAAAVRGHDERRLRRALAALVPEASLAHPVTMEVVPEAIHIDRRSEHSLSVEEAANSPHPAGQGRPRRVVE